MIKENYDRKMEEIILSNQKKGVRPKLLLHACCAPCASTSIERLKDFFDVTIYFYNPNMDCEEEYNKRAEEIKRLSLIYNLPCIIEKYGNEHFLTVVLGLENEKEGGKRCEKCFYLRLDRTAKYGKEKGFDFFSTTLTLSPLKNTELLNRIGSNVGIENNIEFLPSDFKKKDGYKLSIELSKKYNLYRQNYCGCIYSKR